MEVATRPSQPLAFLIAFLSLLLAGTLAHATDLTGKITNAQGGEPLGKVHIAVIGTQLVAVTANDGTFRIANGPAGEQALQISAVGYRTISVPFKSAAAAPGNPNEVTEFSISLLPDNFQHTEKVVVNADIFQSPEWPAVGDTTLTPRITLPPSNNDSASARVFALRLLTAKTRRAPISSPRRSLRRRSILRS